MKDQIFDVVWNRQPGMPILSGKLHEDDKKQSQKESLAFFDSFWHNIAPNAFGINSYQNAK